MVYTPWSSIRSRSWSFWVLIMIEEEVIKDMINTLTNSIREADDLLDQVALACEWREWFYKNHETEILLVSEVLHENNQ